MNKTIMCYFGTKAPTSKHQAKNGEGYIQLGKPNRAYIKRNGHWERVS